MAQNIGQFLTNRARRDTHLEAIYEHATGRRFSYDELNNRSNQVAHALRSLGVSHGDRIGLLLMNGTEFIETFFAVTKVGAVNVPLNWRLVADELEFILDDAGVTVLLFSQEFAEVVAELQSRGDKTQISSWIQVEGEPINGAISYEDWMSSSSVDEPDLEGGDDDLAFIMYTSGTTGLPKGVMHSHDTVLWANITQIALCVSIIIGLVRVRRIHTVVCVIRNLISIRIRILKVRAVEVSHVLASLRSAQAADDDAMR